MRPDEFINSVHHKTELAGLSVNMQALWYAGTGDWNNAHELIQDLPGKDAALLHAYLHRVEGDLWNADYWYNKAGERRPDKNLQEEWETLVNRFI